MMLFTEAIKLSQTALQSLPPSIREDTASADPALEVGTRLYDFMPGRMRPQGPPWRLARRRHRRAVLGASVSSSLRQLLLPVAC